VFLLLQRDIGAERVAEAGDIQLDLLRLHEQRVTVGEGHESLAVVIDGALAPQHRQLTDGDVRQGRPEPSVDQLDELCPCRTTAVELQMMEP
jgi:hypothetical protein